MLSDRVWHEQFSGDPTIVGRQIRLDSDLVTIIGVMPASFVNVLDSTATVWSPLAYDTAHITDFDSEEWGHHLHMIARLRPGVTMPSAIADLDRIAHSRVPEFPRPPFAAMSHGFIVNRLQSEVTRGVKPALLAVLGAVALLLFIAATNVTNLLLARGAQRRGEFAMRSALGASRTRLTRQLVTEAVLLAVLGGALGLLVADIGVKGLVALSPPGLPRVDAIGLHWPVFVFATILVTLVGIAVGLVPGWQLFRHDLHPSLQQAGGRTTTGHEWTRRTLVVTEVSLALVLLVGAGLLLHSLQRLFSVDPDSQLACGDHASTNRREALCHRSRQATVLRAVPRGGAAPARHRRRRLYQPAAARWRPLWRVWLAHRGLGRRSRRCTAMPWLPVISQRLEFACCAGAFSMNTTTQETLRPWS